MKNLLFLAIASLTFASCGNSSAEAEAPKNDSVVVAAVDTTAVVVADSVAASLPTSTTPSASANTNANTANTTANTTAHNHTK